jgi:hypothetical protein
VLFLIFQLGGMVVISVIGFAVLLAIWQAWARQPVG